MTPVDAILDKVDSEIEKPEFLNRVINAVHDLMKMHSLYNNRCSYSLYMSTYVQTKLDIRRLERKSIFAQINNTAEVNVLKNRLRELHNQMYLNPCKVCDTCVNRKKSWNNGAGKAGGSGKGPVKPFPAQGE